MSLPPVLGWMMLSSWRGAGLGLFVDFLVAAGLLGVSRWVSGTVPRLLLAFAFAAGVICLVLALLYGGCVLILRTLNFK